MLVARKLERSFNGRRVVKGIDLTVGEGEVVGLLGPNGAGKTTTFYMLAGITAPTAGEVLLDGEAITHLPLHLRARRGIAYLPQETSIFRKLTVEENLLAIFELLSLSQWERRERLHALLDEFQLSRLSGQRAHTLSGGERRRLEIARALVLSPRFLLLDEPFAGIDPILVAQIQSIVARLREKGIGVLVTDHNVLETLKITDRAFVIFAGEILVEGTPEEILQHPKTREVYLGSLHAGSIRSPTALAR